MIQVVNGKIAENESFITLIGTLSIPGDLFVDIALIIRSTCSHFTVEWKKILQRVDILVGRRRAHLVHNYI